MTRGIVLWNIYIALRNHRYFPILYLMLISVFFNFQKFNQTIAVCIISGSILFAIIWQKRMKHCILRTWLCGCVYFCLWLFTEMFQYDTLNRHRSISTIIFRLYLVRKTSNNPISIITVGNLNAVWQYSPQWFLPSICTWGISNANLWIARIKKNYEN